MPFDAQADLISLLLTRGHLRPADILDGPFEITEVSRRNINHRVVWNGGGVFVKQGMDADRRKTLAHEAELYRFIGGHPHLAGDREALPALIDEVPEDHLVVVALVRGAETCRAKALRTGKVAKRPSILVAKFLAALYRSTRLDGAGPHWDAAHDDRAPFGLTFDAPDRNVLNQSSSGAIQLIRAVQGAPLLNESFVRLRELWRRECLVHGDIRWENCLLLPGRRANPSAALRVVDWELAAYGDPAWDLAAWIAEHLSFWVQSVPIVGLSRDGPSVNSQFALARFPPAKVAPSIATFWDTYAGACVLGPVQRRALLDRVTGFTAARLVQTAFEWSNVAAAPPGGAILALQLAENILRSPKAARLHLFGLHEDMDIVA